MPVIASRRCLRMEDRPDLGPLMTPRRPGGGALSRSFSFGSIHAGTRRDKVGGGPQCLRETSTVFCGADGVGWLLKRKP